MLLAASPVGRRLAGPVAPRPRVGIAVSGGADSLGLLAHVLMNAEQWPIEPLVLCVDHALRDQSGREADHVVALAQGGGMAAEKLVWRRDQARGLHGKLRAARWARYALLADAAKRHGLERLWVAHTCEDQAETLWIRFVRGSGLWGLAGLSSAFRLFGVNFERPTLGLSHHALRQAAVQAFGGGAIIEDPTNDNPATDRGRMRAAYGGRGLPQLPQLTSLLAMGGGLGTWRAGVEARAGALGALTAQRLANHPFECAAWLVARARVLTQREHGLGFDQAMSLVARLKAQSGKGVRRGQHNGYGLSVVPTHIDGEKGWRVVPENDPRRSPSARHIPNEFWRQLFENPSQLRHRCAFDLDEPGFSIAHAGFHTTLWENPRHLADAPVPYWAGSTVAD